MSSDLRFDNETKFETLAEKLVMHPYYIYSADDDEKNLSFDIGLVELEDSIDKGKMNSFCFRVFTKAFQIFM